MFWADSIRAEILSTRKPRNGKTYIIRDEKTLSGRVHVGSMRGVAIHGLIHEVLSEQGVASEYQYELNDIDPFDSIPQYLDAEKFTEHLGKPLFAVPSPEVGYANYAEYFGKEFTDVHAKAGFTPTYYRATELYRSGAMDPLIKTALEKASDVRRILKEVSGSEKAPHWLPVSVICEQCGKIMTTEARDFDGETVEYTCSRSVDGAVPCGHKNRIRPYGGAAKLFWKVDWAAKWIARGVDIEGGGKDHSTRGGSRDAANHIAREIFNFEPPFDIPYEFFLVGGQKMSSSKGRGSSAKDISELFPPEIFRLVLIGKDIREQIDVDPSGDSVPRTFDWYDTLTEGYRTTRDDDYARLFALIHPPEKRSSISTPWNMRFKDLAFIIQMPHLSLLDEAKVAKGSDLTDEERTALEERASYAKFWLQTYAPEEAKYTLQTTPVALTIDGAQRNALTQLRAFLESAPRTGDEIHHELHELKTRVPIAPKDLFAPLYTLFLNRTSGPKMGWFLAGLPRELVLSHLASALA